MRACRSRRRQLCTYQNHNHQLYAHQSCRRQLRTRNAQTPVVQTPVVRTPVARAPIAHAPVVQTPVAQTPVANAQVAQVPVDTVPVVATPIEQAPDIYTPVVQPPVLHVLEMQTPSAPTPESLVPIAHSSMTSLGDYVVDIDPLPMTTLVQNSGVQHSDDTNAQIDEVVMRKGKRVADRRRREEDMERTLREHKGQSDTIQLTKDIQALRDAAHQEEVEALTAAARANSAPSEVDVITDREARASSTHGTGDALTDSALLAHGEMDTVAQVSNTFVSASFGASSFGVSTNSMEMSAIGKAVSDMPDSLNLSSSFSRSIGEVECEAFLACGKRCCDDLTKCDCDAYSLSALDGQYYRELHDRRASEERMLDAVKRTEKIRIACDLDSPSPTRLSQAQAQKEVERSTREILEADKIPPLPTCTDEVEDDNYHADDDEPTGVRNSDAVADGNEKYSGDDVQKILDGRDRRDERYQADNVEPSPPPVRKTFAEAVERASDHKSGIDATSGVQHSTDGSPRATMTATHTITALKVGSQRASASGAGAPSGAPNFADDLPRESQRQPDQRGDRRRTNGGGDGGDGDDDRGRRERDDKDRRGHDERRRRNGPPGGGGGGGPPEGPGNNGGDYGVPNSDDERLPIRVPAYQPGDSDASCADRRRSKGEIAIILPPLPRSAGDLGKSQFAVENIIAIASGRNQHRIEWIDAITQARKPEYLEFVLKKCANLDYRLVVAALPSCEKNQVLYEKLRREGRASGNKNEMCNGWQCLWQIYTYFALPSMATDGLKVTRTVIDLTAIELIGGDNGPEPFWNRWHDCQTHREQSEETSVSALVRG
jgi:hypothetical protein